MTFYEELGVPPDAPLDTIREAYRNVVRLLHPDTQTNPILKETAEAQMKRFNHLYEVLSDPERRRHYDQELAGVSERPETIIIQAPRTPRQLPRANSGTLVWLATTGICAAFIIWLAARESSAPAVYPQPSSGQNSGAPVVPLHTAAASTQPKPGVNKRDYEISALRSELAAANSERERLRRQIATLDVAQSPPSDRGRQTSVPPVSQTMAGLTPAPLRAQAPVEVPIPVLSPAAPPPPHVDEPTPTAKTAVDEASKVKWGGSWAYVHPQTEKPNSALVPPEFIETVISEANGRIRGQYHARFKVGSAKLSPDVNFHFEGKVSGTLARLDWSGTGGAKGEVQLRLVSETALEVNWSATSLGKSMGLASGTAVLYRKK